MSEPREPPRLGFLISGGGRTLVNMAAFLVERPDLGRIVWVISDRPDAGGLERAQALGLPTETLPCQRPTDSDRLFDRFDEQNVEFVLLGGFLRRLRIPERWRDRVLNIHPSLIPKYSGHGFYGDRVHAAVIAAGETESGCTVHLVDDEYDHGRVLVQERVPVRADDTVATLAQRVFEAECRAYPRALEQLLGEARAAEGPSTLGDS